MSAGSERPGGVDHNGRQPGAGLRPGRTDPKFPDRHRLVERLPAIFPAGLDPLGRDLGESPAQRLLDLRPAVDGQLELVREIPLLETVRGELQQLRPRLLGPLERYAHGDPEQVGQWKTPFSRLNRLSSRS